MFAVVLVTLALKMCSGRCDTHVNEYANRTATFRVRKQNFQNLKLD